MSLKRKLNRYKHHLGNQAKEEKTDPPAEKQTSMSVGFEKEWTELGVKPYVFEECYCLIREVVYPLTHVHGHYAFSELHETVRQWNNSTVSHVLSSKGYTPSQLFFFDTETTGLGGGAGNAIFLLGHARVYDDRVVVKQHLLPKPGHEAALYHSFLSEVDIQSLVTYNGKAFDWPQVKTRHTLIRDRVPKLPDFGHFDLLHGSRRLWKHKFDRVSLGTVEKEELGVIRTEDTPGYLAPMMYFHFLKEERPEIIEGVLRHNELDVLSLISLYIHLSKKILTPEQTAEANEKYAMAKWLLANRETELATAQLQELEKKPFEQSERASFDLSMQYKKQGMLKEAAALWLKLQNGEDGKTAWRAGIELAKYLEHRKRDIRAALDVTDNLLQQHGSQKFELTEKEMAGFLRRRERLERKYGRNIPRASAENDDLRKPNISSTL
ncbi:ribonuclease H-like domain-containing protein [Bacillus haynesii]|uniref:ribonuclease H-like domain-containing protein n=1 Tax=Bacillus haynesii TaxID=1925021 RepID=UPI00227E7F0F|nr:ribonuclease H-like domain-containing protein [Bacillus haynesii]MCY8340819.1 ribonuclease H-like domain-containing protein [Bacillus haynesii]